MKLNPQQQVALENLRALKNAYDIDAARFDYEYKIKRDALKEPIRRAVGALMADGVPVRQIHQKGLGMEQVNSMVSFLTAPADKKTVADVLTSTTAFTAPKVETFALKVVDTGKRQWQVTDADGTLYSFDLFDWGKETGGGGKELIPTPGFPVPTQEVIDVILAHDKLAWVQGHNDPG